MSNVHLFDILWLIAEPQGDVPDMGGRVPTLTRATIRLKDCELTDNRRGLLLTHYNNPSNEDMDIFIRTRSVCTEYVWLWG